MANMKQSVQILECRARGGYISYVHALCHVHRLAFKSPLVEYYRSDIICLNI